MLCLPLDYLFLSGRCFNPWPLSGPLFLVEVPVMRPNDAFLKGPEKIVA
jgi:hypothetical protein